MSSLLIGHAQLTADCLLIQSALTGYKCLCCVAYIGLALVLNF